VSSCQKTAQIAATTHQLYCPGLEHVRLNESRGVGLSLNISRNQRFLHLGFLFGLSCPLGLAAMSLASLCFSSLSASGLAFAMTMFMFVVVVAIADHFGRVQRMHDFLGQCFFDMSHQSTVRRGCVSQATVVGFSTAVRCGGVRFFRRGIRGHDRLSSRGRCRRH